MAIDWETDDIFKCGVFSFISGLICSNSLHWRHNDHDGVSNHQPHGCLLNRLFRRRSKKTSKLRVTGLCVGNSPGPVNSPHKGPVTRKLFPFDDVIMWSLRGQVRHPKHYSQASRFVVLCCGFGLIRFWPYLSGLLQWHWNNHAIVPVPLKQSWRIWVNQAREFINNWL